MCNLNLITLDKSKLRNILQTNWSELFRNVKVMKDKDQVIVMSLTLFTDVWLLIAVKPHLSLSPMCPTSGQTNTKTLVPLFGAHRRFKLCKVLAARTLTLAAPLNHNTNSGQSPFLTLPSHFQPALPRELNYVN